MRDQHPTPMAVAVVYYEAPAALSGRVRPIGTDAGESSQLPAGTLGDAEDKP
jgi:hypothetical protein